MSLESFAPVNQVLTSPAGQAARYPTRNTTRKAIQFQNIMMSHTCIYCNANTVQLFKGDGIATAICKHHANHKFLETKPKVMTQNAAKRTLFAYSKKMQRFHKGWARRRKFLRSPHDVAWREMKKEQRPCNFVKDNSIVLPQQTYGQFVRFFGEIEWNHMKPLNLAVEKKCRAYNNSVRRYHYLIWTLLQALPGSVCNIIAAYAGMEAMVLVDHDAFFQQCKEFAIQITTNGCMDGGYRTKTIRRKRKREAWEARPIPMLRYKYKY